MASVTKRKIEQSFSSFPLQSREDWICQQRVSQFAQLILREHTPIAKYQVLILLHIAIDLFRQESKEETNVSPQTVA